MENHNIKSKPAQKPYDENTWHVNVRKTMKFQFFMYFTSLLLLF